MGSWNALCITLPDEDDHEAALREMLDADWRELSAGVPIPADARQSAGPSDVDLSWFELLSRGDYLYCRGSDHTMNFGTFGAVVRVVLDRLGPEWAVETLSFEDGQGSCTMYAHVDALRDGALDHYDPIEGGEYVLTYEHEDWESPYGVEHAANAVGTEYGIDVGIGKLGFMYVLDVSRERL